MVEFIFLKNYFLSFTTKFKTTFIRLISLNNSSKFNNKINKIKNQFITFTMGIGDWGLGIGDWGLGPIPNPQSPIPNPQSPIPNDI